MLLYLFDYLSKYYSGFNVFQYLTLRIILAALTALFTSLILGPPIIQIMKNRNMYQSVRDDGPKSHIAAKANTPSMGGLIIIISIVISTLLWADIYNTNIWVLLFIGFAIKVPVFPFHTWLPLAHVEAPTAISVILAGVLLKLGVYGMLRINYTMLPDGVFWFAGALAVLGLINVIWGAMCALAQNDLKN